MGCWQHARRKFTDAQKALPRSERQQSTRIQQALRFIARFYAIEKIVKNKPSDERYGARQEKSLPVLTELKKWLEQRKVYSVKPSRIP